MMISATMQLMLRGCTYRSKSQDEGINLEQKPSFLFRKLPSIPNITLPGPWFSNKLFPRVIACSFLVDANRASVFVGPSHGVLAKNWLGG